jgi:hypothetical protein
VVLALSLQNLGKPARAQVAKWVPTPVAQILDLPSPATEEEDSTVLTGEADRPHYVIGPAAAEQEVRVWAIRGGNNYGWIQLPKGTHVRLLRQEGDWLVIRYEESVVKIHRSVAEAGMVIPVKNRRVAVL